MEAFAAAELSSLLRRQASGSNGSSGSGPQWLTSLRMHTAVDALFSPSFPVFL